MSFIKKGYTGLKITPNKIISREHARTPYNHDKGFNPTQTEMTTFLV